MFYPLISQEKVKTSVNSLIYARSCAKPISLSMFITNSEKQLSHSSTLQNQDLERWVTWWRWHSWKVVRQWWDSGHLTVNVRFLPIFYWILANNTNSQGLHFPFSFNTFLCIENVFHCSLILNGNINNRGKFFTLFPIVLLT